MSKEKSATDLFRDWEARRKEKMAERLMSTPAKKSLLGAMRFPGVALIMGDHGSGKSVLAHYIMEEYHKRGKVGAMYLPSTLVYLRKPLKRMLPKWVTICTDLDAIPHNSVCVYDEAAQGAHARRTQTNDAIDLDSMVGISRQRNGPLESAVLVHLDT